MKKYFLLVVSAVALAFSSCSDSEEVDIKYQVNFTISPETVISDFQGYKSGNLQLDDDTKLRIRNLIYDENYNLVKSSEGLVNQYSENLQFAEILPEGDYTVITTTDVVTGNSSSNITSSYWNFTKENNLNDFTITRENRVCFMGESTLGLIKSTLKVNGQSTTLKINVKPITALITFHFRNIHQQKNYNNKVLTPIYLEFQYKNKMDIIKYQNNEWAISTSAAETEIFRLDYIDLTNSYYDDSNNIYNLIAALPSNTEFNGYVDFIDSDGETYNGLTDNVSVNLESGKQYDFVFDLYSMTLVAESKNKSVMKSNYRTLQKRLFESNNSKKSFYAIEFLN